MKKNISLRSAKFISSHQMESSETQRRVIKLGKALVKELDSQPSTDTLSHWMSYYIAEKIAISEKANGDAKAEAERECFHVILELWEHRSYLPIGIRPFKNFDLIFRTLEKISPENEEPFFYQRDNFPGKENSDLDTEEMKIWLSIASVIEKTARIWLAYAFHQAALYAMDETTINWLENAIRTSETHDTSIIIQLINGDLKEKEEIGNKEKSIRQKTLQSRIEQLEAFREFSKYLLAAYEEELMSLSKENSPKTDDSPGNKD